MSYEKPKKTSVISRRDFVFAVPTLATATVMTADLKRTLGSIPKRQIELRTELEDLNFFGDPEMTKEQFRYTKNYEVHLRTAEINFINIGVSHINEWLSAQLNETPMGQIIQSADIICLEWGDYFSNIANLATKEQKVENIDRSNNIFSQVLGITTLPWIFARLIKDLGTDKISLRRLLTTIALSSMPVSLFSPSFQMQLYLKQAVKNNLHSDSTPNLDFSHILDGRTVFMALDIEKIKEQNPGKKLVVITGDFHAILIHEYLHNKKFQLLIKKYVYNAIYGIFKKFESKL